LIFTFAENVALSFGPPIILRLPQYFLASVQLQKVVAPGSISGQILSGSEREIHETNE